MKTNIPKKSYNILIFTNLYALSILFGYSMLFLIHAQEIETGNSSSNVDDQTAVTIFYDPTKPKNFAGSSPDLKDYIDPNNDQNFLNLSLIITKEYDKTAIINQQPLKEREQINGLEIIKIEDHRVLLQPIATTDLSSTQKLEQLSKSNPFIKKHLLNNYIELSLPEKKTKTIIDFNTNNNLNDKNNL